MRNLSSALQTAMAAGQLRPAIFVQLGFSNETIYLWSGLGSKSWNGQTWQGVGSLGKIEPISESTGIEALGLKLILTSIPNQYLTDVLNYITETSPVTVWFGLLDSNENVIASPYESFSGYMDAPILDEGTETSTVTISVESKLLDMRRQRERRYTHEDQQIDFPGDLGFEYVSSIQEWNGTGLPKAPPYLGAPAGPAYGSGNVGPGGGGGHTGGPKANA